MKRLAIAVLFLGASSIHAAKIDKLTLSSRGSERSYYLFVPDGLKPDQPAPLLLVFHGSGRNGNTLVDPWRPLAQKEHFIVAGPDATNKMQWDAPADGPTLLRDLVDDVSKRAAVDRKRIYLFGHSAGAGFALQMAMIESEFFAAGAIHAGDLKPESYSLLDFATRKVPFAIFVGTQDPLFPLSVVRTTRDEMVKRGFTAELTEIARHDHNYYAIAPRINEAAWAFLSKYSLPADGKFVEYANMQ
jgi:poly(3-hydroxybutyrate) depolymerase